MNNIIQCVKGNPVSFSVYHEVDGKQYELQENEKYRVKIKKNLGDDEPDFVGDSSEPKFDFAANLECGKYYFEIDLVAGEVETAISPATNTDVSRRNTLYITERL